jgi:hypothetical protein
VTQVQKLKGDLEHALLDSGNTILLLQQRTANVNTKQLALSSEVGATRSTKTYMSIKFSQEVDFLRHSTLSSWENSSEALMKYHS